MKELLYVTEGTCSKAIKVTVGDDRTISSVDFLGGCPGNTLGVAALVQGMNVDEAISRLKGIRCGNKQTSCPDQLTKALEQI